MFSRHLIWFGYCVIAVFALISTGCSGHLVRVIGKVPTGEAVSISPGSKIYFFEDIRDEPESIGALRFRKNVEQALTDHGYQPSDIQHADYFMVLDYGVSSDRQVQETIPMVTAYASFPNMIIRNPDQTPPTLQPDMPMTTMVPHTRTVHDVWVLTRLMDSDHYRQHGIMKEVWSGKAWISDKRTASMGKAVSAMLPHIIDTMGQATEKEAFIKSRDIFFQSLY